MSISNGRCDNCGAVCNNSAATCYHCGYPPRGYPVTTIEDNGVLALQQEIASLREQLAELMPQRTRGAMQERRIATILETAGIQPEGTVANGVQRLADKLAEARLETARLTEMLEHSGDFSNAYDDTCSLLTKRGVPRGAFVERIKVVITRMESAERELAALKAQGCETCAFRFAGMAPAGCRHPVYCKLTKVPIPELGTQTYVECCVLGSGCRAWVAKAPVAPTPSDENVVCGACGGVNGHRHDCVNAPTPEG
jgi:hypothetical protein